VSLQLLTVGDEVLVFFNDPAPFQNFVEIMRSERDRLDPDGLLLYHTNLVQLLALCTEGKNVYTEIKCHSLLPLDDIVKVVTHPDCIPEVGMFHVCQVALSVSFGHFTDLLWFTHLCLRLAWPPTSPFCWHQPTGSAAG